ncbi:MAG: GxxExxY protein [Candidatus Curtissbacteria bacterium]
MAELIYPELSYELMGILFRVHRKMGNRYQEKYYQRAIEIELTGTKIPYKKEFLIQLDYSGKNIGKYFLDFVIDDKIALEIKAVPELKQDYFNQVLAYLDIAKLKLGIVANFRTPRLSSKRLVNPRIKL